MTKLDYIRMELRKQGVTKAQTESSVLAKTLDIIEKTGSKYADIVDDEKELTFRLKELKLEEESFDEHLNMLEERKKYIDDFYEALKQCETQEGRDTMRAAQMFVNTININTEYDNYAFIAGLAAILSKGGTGPLGELKKINKDLSGLSNQSFTKITFPEKRKKRG